MSDVTTRLALALVGLFHSSFGVSGQDASGTSYQMTKDQLDDLAGEEVTPAMAQAASNTMRDEHSLLLLINDDEVYIIDYEDLDVRAYAPPKPTEKVVAIAGA